MDVPPRVATIFPADKMMKANIPPATIVGVVASEQFHLGTDGNFEDIAGPGRVNL
jgi:hypothetical protein